ncbi:unnamed protein product [Jaminaea pallidilutea]
MSGRPCWSGTSEQLAFHNADLPLGAEAGASVALGTPVLPAVTGDKKEKRRAQNRESQKAFRRRKAEQDAELHKNHLALQTRCEKLAEENERLRQLLSASHVGSLPASERFYGRSSPSDWSEASTSVGSKSDGLLRSFSVASSLSEATSMNLKRRRRMSAVGLQPCLPQTPDIVPQVSSQELLQDTRARDRGVNEEVGNSSISSREGSLDGVSMPGALTQAWRPLIESEVARGEPSLSCLEIAARPLKPGRSIAAVSGTKVDDADEVGDDDDQDALPATTTVTMKT